jgi:hypothetical protein
MIQSNYELRVSKQASSCLQEYSSKLEEYSKQAVSWRSTEKYKKSGCEDLTCDLKALFVL